MYALRRRNAHCSLRVQKPVIIRLFSRHFPLDCDITGCELQRVALPYNVRQAGAASSSVQTDSVGKRFFMYTHSTTVFKTNGHVCGIHRIAH